MQQPAGCRVGRPDRLAKIGKVILTGALDGHVQTGVLIETLAVSDVIYGITLLDPGTLSMNIQTGLLIETLAVFEVTHPGARPALLC